MFSVMGMVENGQPIGEAEHERLCEQVVELAYKGRCPEEFFQASQMV